MFSTLREPRYGILYAIDHARGILARSKDDARSWRRWEHGTAPVDDDHSYESSTISGLPADGRVLIEWARGVAPRDEGRIFPVPPMLRSADLPTMHAASFGIGHVHYFAAGLLERRMPGGVMALHGLVDGAVADAARVWGWPAVGLEVGFHEGGDAFGLAYSPGTGADSGRRIISLRADYLALWDLAAIRGTVLHELCHHYRDERFPEPPPLRKRSIAEERTRRSHDEVFCRELSRVDPAATDYRACAFEGRPPDVARKAARDSARAVRSTKVRATREATVARGTDWTPSAGVLVWSGEDGGREDFAWAPRPGATRFVPWKARVNHDPGFRGYNSAEDVFEYLIARWPIDVWGRVRVRSTVDGYSPSTFRELVRTFAEDREILNQRGPAYEEFMRAEHQNDD